MAYVTQDKYILENRRIEELGLLPSGKNLHVRDVNQFVDKCSKYPLFDALNPTMMIICDQIMTLMSSEDITDLKDFFEDYVSDIKIIFGGRKVKKEKILQDMIVYINHLTIINGSIGDEDNGDVELGLDQDNNVYPDYVDEDDGDEYEEDDDSF